MSKVPMDKVTQGVITYFEDEVMPHLPNTGWQGFGIGFVSTLALSRIGSIMQQLTAHPVVAMLEIVDADGRVDVDELYKAAMQAMPEEGMQIGVLGHQLKFKRDDVKKLRDMIMQQ